MDYHRRSRYPVAVGLFRSGRNSKPAALRPLGSHSDRCRHHPRHPGPPWDNINLQRFDAPDRSVEADDGFTIRPAKQIATRFRNRVTVRLFKEINRSIPNQFGVQHRYRISFPVSYSHFASEVFCSSFYRRVLDADVHNVSTMALSSQSRRI